MFLMRCITIQAGNDLWSRLLVISAWKKLPSRCNQAEDNAFREASGTATCWKEKSPNQEESQMLLWTLYSGYIKNNKLGKAIAHAYDLVNEQPHCLTAHTSPPGLHLHPVAQSQGCRLPWRTSRAEVVPKKQT